MKQTPKKGIVLDAAAATAEEAAGATATPTPPFQPHLVQPPAAPAAGAAATEEKALESFFTRFRGELPKEAYVPVADLLYGAGDVRGADIMRTGKHEDTYVNAVRRFGGMNIKVWHFPVITGGLFAAGKVYNEYVADWLGTPKVRLLGK